jgi:hypothetical protein
MTTKHLSLLAAAAFTLGYLNGAGVSAQSPPSDAQDEQSVEALEMIVNPGQGNETRRHPREGVMGPAELALDRTAIITLQFLGNRAGQTITVTPLDGGEVLPPTETLTISAQGNVTFGFRVSGITGLYRVLVGGMEQCELRFYAFDPNRPRTPRDSTGGQ